MMAIPIGKDPQGGVPNKNRESRSTVLTTIALFPEAKSKMGPPKKRTQIFGGDSNKHEGKFMRNGFSDIRRAKKREREFYRREELRRRRKEKAAKNEHSASQKSATQKKSAGPQTNMTNGADI